MTKTSRKTSRKNRKGPTIKRKSLNFIKLSFHKTEINRFGPIARGGFLTRGLFQMLLNKLFAIQFYNISDL